MSCSPGYTYRPTTRPEPSQSSAPTFTEHRSRLFAGATFFRSIRQGSDRNNISLEAIVTPTDVTLNVRFNAVIQETFVAPHVFVPVPPPGTCTGGIAALRTAVNAGSALIEMPARGFDVFDRTPPWPAVGGAPNSDPMDNCVVPFADTPMTGGDGPPTTGNQPFLDSVFTGTERTLIVIFTTEDATGFSVDAPQSRRVQQWDGTQWIQYSNLSPGDCPIDGPPVTVG